jgi:predicted amidohydrolase YtcJ
MLLTLTLFLVAAETPAGLPPADLVLTGGAVYTMGAARSWAQAVAIRDGRIAYVGTDVGARAFVGPRTRVVALGGRLVLPAFQDAHVHPVSGGVELGQCNVNELATKDAILAKVADCATASEKPWIVGGGWPLPAFPNASPTKDLLDGIVRDRPVFLNAADGHSGWANSKALELAGITAATPDPPNGRIERDASGAPTGTLREAAQRLVERHIPEPTAEERLEGLRRALSLFNAFGITAVYEANAGGGPKGGEATLAAYREAERRGLLTVRVRASLGTDPSRGPEQVDDLVRLRREYSSPRLRPVAAKVFVDGVIESRTAAMLEPYDDRPGDRGEPRLDEARLRALVARLVEEDFAVHVHAIGDRAVRMTLDAFEASRQASLDRGLRHQITHLQVIAPADVPRFRSLGVIANFEPLWAFADAYVRDLTWPALGPERSKRMYPIADLVRSGAIVSFGSDWSVSSPNPLEGIQVAVTRQSPDAKERVAPLLPEQSIDLPAAIAAYTMGAAWANGLESETGSLEVGKSGDLVVLSDDLFALKPDEIARAHVLLTLFAGEAVHHDPSLPLAKGERGSY